MRMLAVLLLLAGCASDQAPGTPGSANVRVNGSYTTFGGVVLR